MGKPAGNRRRWWFRVGAVALALLAFGGVELGLRAAGVGYPTAFFLAPGEGELATNPRFGWRFFPPALARAPVAQVVATPAPTPGLRVVVLGESAAMGTPDPDFGLAAQLEVMLEAASGAEVEVVNAALAAINSHVVREVAGELDRLEPDLVVVYLGNNEIVGPFGPGSVFSPGLARLPLVRSTLALRRLRLAQVVENGVRRLRPQPPRWGGMAMFTEHEVAPGDPRLARSHDHFAANLEAIVSAAKASGAQVVVSTVAVDQLDTPPFGSVANAVARGAVDRAVAALAAGDTTAARTALNQALAAAPGHALALWVLGRLELGAGNLELARTHLAAATDHDTLRFRATSNTNAVVRDVAAANGVTLVDAAAVLAAAPESRRGLAGEELFWEHVHLTPIGTYRVAEAVVGAVSKGIGGQLGVTGPTPPVAQVLGALTLGAEDLARMSDEITAMTARAPFTGQLGHTERQAGRRERAFLAGVNARLERARDRERLEARVSAFPDDQRARRRLASFLARTGDSAGAERHWRALVERHPNLPSWRTELGFALLDQGRHELARTELALVAEHEPWSAQAWTNLGLADEQLGNLEAAETSFRLALDRDPAFLEASLALAALTTRAGDPAAGEARYRDVVAREPTSVRAWLALASHLDQQGRAGDAEATYRKVLELEPELALAHNNLGLLLEARGDRAAAALSYRAALASDPFAVQARCNLADLLLAHGHLEEAVEHYQLALEIDPKQEQARRNLAVALGQLGRSEAAAGAAEVGIEGAPAG